MKLELEPELAPWPCELWGELVSRQFIFHKRGREPTKEVEPDDEALPELC